MESIKSNGENTMKDEIKTATIDEIEAAEKRGFYRGINDPRWKKLFEENQALRERIALLESGDKE